MEKINKYIIDNTDDVKKDNRKIKNKYDIKIKIVSAFLASSNLFGFVLLPEKVDKRINNVMPIVIEKQSLAREYRDNLSTLPTDSTGDIIERWANVFELKPEIVKEIIYKETENFTNENVLNEYYDEYIDDHNFTKAIIFFIREINKNPEKYGYSRNEIESGIDFETYLTREETVVILGDIIGVDPYFGVGVMRTEWGHPNTGNPNSYNSFGWGASGIKNVTMGILIPLIGLNKNYGLTKEVTDGDIRSVSYSYCENPEKWSNAVIYQVDDVKENGIFSDYSDDEIDNMAIENYTYEEYINNGYHIPTFREKLNKKRAI